jgi:hypothetical protein
MTEDAFVLVGNLNEPLDVPWPPDLPTYAEAARLVQERRDDQARQTAWHQPAAECARWLDEAAATWQQHVRLCAAGWHPGTPSTAGFYWVLLVHGLGTDPPLVFVEEYTPEGDWSGIEASRVAYWYPLTLPPGPVRPSVECSL